MKKLTAVFIAILFALSVTGLCFAQATGAPAPAVTPDPTMSGPQPKLTEKDKQKMEEKKKAKKEKKKKRKEERKKERAAPKPAPTPNTIETK